MSDTQISGPELTDATRQIAVLTRLGFPLADGLKAIGEGQSRWLTSVAKDLAQGDTLADSTGRHPRIFSPFYQAMVRAAEAAENPGHILTALGHWLERADTVQRQARTSLFYPLLILNAALLELLLLLAVVVPTVFVPLFQMSGRPLSTEMVAAFQSPLLAVGFIALIVLLDLYVLRCTTTVALVSILPGMGPLQRLAQQGLWCEALGTLLAAGLPLPAALRQSHTVVSDTRLAAPLQSLADAVDRGDALSDALHDVPALDPCIAWSVAAGERREEIAPLLLDAAIYIDRQVDRRLTHALRMLEPWSHLAVGIVVASVLVAFWGPFYHLVGHISQ